MKALPLTLKNRIIDALNHISADGPRDEWLKVGMALSAYGDEGFALFNAWSSTSSKYPGTAKIIKEFQSFKPGVIKVGTIFWLSKQAGHSALSVADATIFGANTTGQNTSFKPACEAGGNDLEAEREARIKRAKRIWSNGWSCQSSDEVYAGSALDRAGNVVQRGHIRESMHHIRDAAFSYFQNRLLDTRWMPQLRLFALDMKEKDDFAMQKQGAIGGIAIPMLKNGVVIGLQRVYLDKSGQKISRMMLGGLGTMPLAPLADRPLIALPSIREILLWGEGFETCAIAVQASGLPALVLFTEGQIVTRSAMYRAQSKTATAEQIAAMPLIGLLVDRDTSLTGQKSCTKAAQHFRAAGMQSLYLEPPSLVHGGEKGADWADAGLELGMEATGLALAVAMDKQPAIPEEKPERANPIVECPDEPDYGHHDEYAPDYEDLANFGIKAYPRNWRPISSDAEKSLPVECQDADTVRSEVMAPGIERLIDAYIQYLDEYKEAIEAAGDDENDLVLPEFTPFLFPTTTGVGKSSLLKRLPDHEKIVHAGGAVRIFVATNDERDEYCEANPAFFKYHGRSPEMDSPGYCPNHAEMMKVVDAGHIPQAEFCFNCKNGLKWSLENHDEGSKPHTKSLEKLHGMGLSDEQIKEIKTCVWQSHLREAIREQYVAATHFSFSENLAIWHQERKNTPALCCFDEHVPMSSPLEKVTMERVSEWARRNASNVRTLQYTIEHESNDFMKAKLRDDLESAYKAETLLQGFADALAELVGKTARIPKSSTLWTAIDDLILIGTKTSKTLASWEKVAFEKDGSLSATPLRAAYGIAQTLKAADGLIEDGALYVSAIKPILERLGHAPTAFFDATPSPVLTSIIKATHGIIIDAVARQHVEIQRYTDRFYGLTPLKLGDTPRRRQEIERYEKIMDYFAGRKFVFHKAATDILDVEHDELGHWGADHRAQNRFELSSMVIAGSFFVPPAMVRRAYQSDRLAAIAGGADPEDWPLMQDYTPILDDKGVEHDGAFESGVWVREGDHEVLCKLPLPRQPQIREWFLTRSTLETVQAIGRARGANADPEKPLQIAIFGGLPLFGLGEHGLTVHSYQDDPVEIGGTKSARNFVAHSAAQESATAAALRIVADGASVGRESMSSQVKTDRIAAEVAKIRNNYNNNNNQEVKFEEAICPPMVIKPYNHGGTNTKSAPVDAQKGGLQKENYQEWLSDHGMRIFAKHMSAKGRAGAAVKAARAAIDNQPAQDAQAMFERLEAFARGYERDVRDGIDISFDEAVKYDRDGFDQEMRRAAMDIDGIMHTPEPDALDAQTQTGGV